MTETHRPAVTPVADVHYLLAESGATTAVAPPPQARRTTASTDLPSLAAAVPPGVARQVEVEHAVRIAALESLLAEARQDAQSAQESLAVERARVEVLEAELVAVHATADVTAPVLTVARAAADALAAYVHARWDGTDVEKHYEAARSAALAWEEVDRG